MSDDWWLYLIECKGGAIYTGIARDVDKRFEQHLNGKGAKYTRMNPPVRILARKPFPDKGSALRAECAMKRQSPEEKRRWAEEQ